MKLAMNRQGWWPIQPYFLASRPLALKIGLVLLYSRCHFSATFDVFYLQISVGSGGGRGNHECRVIDGPLFTMNIRSWSRSGEY